MARSTVPAILGFCLVSSAILAGACSFPDFTTTSWSSGTGGSTASSSGSGGSGAGGSSTSSSGTGGSTASSSSTGGSAPTCDAGVPLCEGGACSCDCDGDGQMSLACEPDPAKADCNDAVKAAKHGQIACSASPVVVGTQDFDWNCDGSSTFCFTQIVGCLTAPCDATEKWSGPGIPACGVMAPTSKCIPGIVPGTCATASVGMRAQTCL